eukprot:scaffold748_cov251-Pinguiococcus_pyrenoidosus.AAC.60
MMNPATNGGDLRSVQLRDARESCSLPIVIRQLPEAQLPVVVHTTGEDGSAFLVIPRHDQDVKCTAANGPHIAQSLASVWRFQELRLLRLQMLPCDDAEVIGAVLSTHLSAGPSHFSVLAQAPSHEFARTGDQRRGRVVRAKPIRCNAPQKRIPEDCRIKGAAADQCRYVAQ